MARQLNLSESYLVEDIVDTADDLQLVIDSMHHAIQSRKLSQIDPEHLPTLNDLENLMKQMCDIERNLSSMLMVTGRLYGAKYWNVGVAHHDWLDGLHKRTGYDTGQTPEL